MLDEIKKELSSIRLLVLLLIIAVGLYLFQILWSVLANFSDIFLVLIFSWLLSFILEPVVNNVSQLFKLKRSWAAVLTYLLLAAVIAIGIAFYLPTVGTQIQKLSTVLPARLDGTPPIVARGIEAFTRALNNSFTYLPSVAQFLLDFLIILIVSFYLLIDRENIQSELLSLTPRRWHKNIEFVQSIIESTFASFLRIQLIFAIISGITTCLVLLFTGVDFIATSAFLAGLLTLIPLIGPILALIPPVLAAFILGPTQAILVFVLLLLIQQIEFNIYGPRLMGQTFKLHPIIVLLSFLVGFKIFGSIGAIFAVPVLGILAVMIREFGHYFISSKRHE